MRRSPIRFVLIPMGVVLVGLGIYHLFRERSAWTVLTGVVTGGVMIAVCFYDAPDSPAPVRQTGEAPPPPGTQRRVAIASWSLLVFCVGAPAAAVLLGWSAWSAWLLIAPLVPIFGVLTVLQARAEQVSPWTVLRRSFDKHS